MSCPVCIENYTQEKRRKIQCESCSYEVCSECAKRYILDTPESPHCMNCNTSWGRVVLSKKFSTAFMNTKFKTARENVLLDREKSMFQATQPYIEIEKRKNDIVRNIQENKRTIIALMRARRQLVIVDMDTKIRDIELRRSIVNLELDTDQLLFEHTLLINGSIETTTGIHYHNKCPREKCSGFLNNKWKCAVCSLYACKDCHEPVDDDTHVCDPNTVETIKHLATQEYRKCPKCSMSIFKTEGCLQMFCISCKTAFNWKTGQIVTGRIHNPHYYEYMRNRGQNEREIGDVQCGGLPDVYTVTAVTGWDHPLIRFHRMLVEFNDYEVRPLEEVETFQINLEQRVQFIMNRISESHFKALVQQRDKLLQKKREIGFINTTFIQIMTDIYGRLTRNNIESIENEIVTACEYVNGLWREIGKAYSCVFPNAQLKPHPQIINNMKLR